MHAFGTCHYLIPSLSITGRHTEGNSDRMMSDDFKLQKALHAVILQELAGRTFMEMDFFILDVV
jgi:hypothetical protein